MRKHHALCHLVFDLETVPAVNPWLACCFMEEDFIGRAMSILKACCVRSATTRPIEFMNANLSLMLAKRQAAA